MATDHNREGPREPEASPASNSTGTENKFADFTVVLTRRQDAMLQEKYYKIKTGCSLLIVAGGWPGLYLARTVCLERLRSSTWCKNSRV